MQQCWFRPQVHRFDYGTFTYMDTYIGARLQTNSTFPHTTTTTTTTNNDNNTTTTTTSYNTPHTTSYDTPHTNTNEKPKRSDV
jgi:hypothetical protein